jgi:hypothetical protein
MIDAIIVEVPNPRHPYGPRGVGETPIVSPVAAIAHAIENAPGTRFTELLRAGSRPSSSAGERRVRRIDRLELDHVRTHV